jgi:flagellar biosynthesis component FlhA
VSDRPPPSSQELAASLAVNAAGKPLNLAVGIVAFVVALVAGAPAVVALLVALVLYTAAVGRTMFDRDEAERVTQKQYAARRGDDES